MVTLHSAADYGSNTKYLSTKKQNNILILFIYLDKAAGVPKAQIYACSFSFCFPLVPNLFMTLHKAIARAVSQSS